MSQNFVTVRPSVDLPLLYFWAVLNAPFSNAYVFARSRKRHILEGTLRKLPFPKVLPSDTLAVVGAAQLYLEEMQTTEPDHDKARELLLRMEAEVMRLYDLPPIVEREVLELLSKGTRRGGRPGVPFEVRPYYPDDFEPLIPLHVLISPEFQRSSAGRIRERKAALSKERD